MNSSKYIYRYTDPSRNEVIYVGQGTKTKKGDGYQRSRAHKIRTDKHPFVQRLQKMAHEGVYPIIDILIEGIDKELADLIEIEAIDKYGRKDLGKGTLLNLTNGGDGAGTGRIVSQEERDKISRDQKGRKKSPETMAKLAGINKGRKHTEVSRKNMSDAHKGKPLPDGHPFKVKGRPANNRKACTIDGITIYESRKALYAALGRGKSGGGHPNFRYVEKASKDV